MMVWMHASIVRTISFLTAVLLCLSPTQAQYSGGRGTATDPYQIATAADLIALGETTTDYDKHFILTADIDLDPNLPGRKVFDNAVIAGAWKPPFTGVFDGKGHMISHLTIVGEFSLGLFGQLGSDYQRQSYAEPTCLVTNLAVEDVNVVGSVISAGALAAYVEWAVVSHSRSTGKVSGKDTVGGLVGYNQYAVMNCHSACTVSGSSDVGGLLGNNNGSVTDCYTTGTVSGGSAVGGLVGWHRGSITQSFSTGGVSGEEAVGGLVGYNGNGSVLHRTTIQPGDIDRSFSTAAVKGETCVGGLIGEDMYGSVRQCYSTGAVAGSTQVGGLVSGPAPALDVNPSFDVTASFWDVETSGLTASSGGQAKTTAEMKTAKTFLDAGWDFVGETKNGTDDIWRIAEGLDYPRLAWEKYSGGNGTAQAPYQIATAADLIALGETPADYDKHFILTADIDLDPNLSGRRAFDKAVIAPDTDAAQADFQGAPFTGVFDGGGHTIRHLAVKGGSCLGLFGQSQGEIRNLGVAGVEITGSGDAVGGLVGWNQGIVTQCYSAGAVAGEAAVGGLVGQNEGRVTQCHSSGSADGNDLVGGLVGSNGFDSSPGLIGQCYSASVVIGKGLNVGGLVGRQPRGGSAALCFWDTEASGRTTSAGGVGKTTVEMHTAKIFLDVGWDFVGETKNGTEDVWWILEGKDYPRFQWEQAVKYGGGTGEPNDPYLIYTAQQMNTIGTEPNDWGKHFKVMADIDLSACDGKNGRPAFNIIAPDTLPDLDYFQGIAFTGVFDGGGHKLSHLTIKGVSYLGLFSELGSGAQVKGVWIEDANVTGSGDGVGALAATNRGSIIDCSSTGVVSVTQRQDGPYLAGGLLGSNLGDVQSCHSSATVNGGAYVGGLMGDNWGTISQCYAGGSVLGAKSVGGLVGENYGAVTRCYSLGPVTGDSNVGGLAGENYQGRVTDSYSTGAVSGSWYVGGLIGTNGGLTSDGKLAAATRCYSAGAVKGQSYVGGLVGSNLAAVTYSFWDRQVSGQATSAGGTAKSTAEMRTAATFLTAGWDFVGEIANGTEDIWQIQEGKDYPRLRWQQENAGP